ncbi:MULTISPECIES: cupin domain-containing protein [unclassified Micromonospora]|uniref:cupin domain-containing protein n=1 Tax=unclassified Micromonospora TaxID=2617518 RepID=UPI00098CF7DA|nr:MULTISPECIES: cupin domain-containing protein [unclassified Micromonospora]MDI5938324.1 cupin domain-containing protein [Micromonospora sp. DH15]OON27937.1 transcriptional regulator [Micromonospora sp. Rc5]
MTLTTVPRTATGLEEKPLGPPSAQPLSGEILVRSRVDFTNEARTVISGVWESDPGTSRWEFLTRGEIIHVVSGRMTVHRDGEEPAEVTAGSTAYFPIGWCGTWTVHETLRKVYVVFKS